MKANQLPCDMQDQLSVLQKEKETLSNTVRTVSMKHSMQNISITFDSL